MPPMKGSYTHMAGHVLLVSHNHAQQPRLTPRSLWCHCKATMGGDPAPSGTAASMHNLLHSPGLIQLTGLGSGEPLIKCFQVRQPMSE